MFGYFPSYAFGVAAAAQLFEAATAADSEILPQIATGNFVPYFNWTRLKVHEKASSLSSDAITKATPGRLLDADSLLRHLGHRYRMAH